MKYASKGIVRQLYTVMLLHLFGSVEGNVQINEVYPGKIQTAWHCNHLQLTTPLHLTENDVNNLTQKQTQLRHEKYHTFILIKQDIHRMS